MGEPAGVGLELTLKIWRAAATTPQAAPPYALLLYADPAAVAAYAGRAGLPDPCAVVATPREARTLWPERLPVMPVRLACAVEPGRPDAANAAAVIASIEEATAAVVGGDAAALVTNPIAKSVLYGAGFAHPGHTELLAELAGRLVGGRTWRPVMLLASDELRVVPLTVHIPLAAVPRGLSRDLIVETVRILEEALLRDFALGGGRPRIAVAGLNPHAGEGGALGTEERQIIAPAIADLRAEGLAVTGPHSADTLFHAEARAGYDAAVAMYHDQALIPIKTLAFDRAVNVTLGLPFVRTSPDHGTAFDIAGSGRASPASLAAALALAARLAANRAKAPAA
ncbi:MAG: 4-hydroxythreonine-4-phosphate dehydrogenase PdxA [Hyphomicrobiaceae bacterium]|nr:4-hydroxythreonine-4-phosphate dehydrogenase PdxA [Hyphomicrobiaceae bacterium]